MAWTRFSAEACQLESRIRRLSARGEISQVLIAIEEALEKAYRDGPSNMSYEEYEAILNSERTGQ